MPGVRACAYLGLWTAALALVAPPAAARESHPYLDVGFGVGVSTLNINLEPEGTHELLGFPMNVDVRLFHPSNHGGGLSLTYVEVPSILGGPTPHAIVVDALYVLRGAPERRFHVVPALFVGPSYLHYDAIEPEPSSVCTTTCPPDASLECFVTCAPGPVVAQDHHALGAVAGLNLDFHGEVLFGGLELAGRYALPIADEVDVSEWGLHVMLRFGFTLRRLGAGRASSPFLDD